MHAAIFDIDGTLLDSYGIDNSMYADAVRSAMRGRNAPSENHDEV
jgi:beta-phosphoglucomutase-like phosphatase (HAD superfamily)